MQKCGVGGCSRLAVAYIPYSGRNMCRRHFMDFFERRVFRTIRKFRLFRPHARVAVALSGGKDSSVALIMVKKLASEKKFPLEIVAISVDEGVGEYRRSLLKNARSLCEKLGVEHVVVSFKEELGIAIEDIAGISREKRESTCTYCGVFRRYLLNKTAREMGCECIVLGHNLDDLAQTFIMNMLRNEPDRLVRLGPKAGVVSHKKFVTRVKPLIETPEKEVAVYAILSGIPLKFMPCPYAHEAYRSEVRNFLNMLEENQPGTKYRLLNSFMVVKEALSHSEGNPNECIRCGELTNAEVCKTCELLCKLGVRR
ncbi:MAG: TIGR00269 family protein [Candidatus Micrarchaeia archaeon]